MDHPQQAQSSNNKSTAGKAPLMIGILVVILIILSVILFKRPSSSDSMKNENAPPPVQEPPPSSAHSSVQGVSYANGTYEAIGNYQSPGGSEQIGVLVTLQDGVIADISVKPMATRPISQNMQGQFASGYKTLVIGKNIDEVKLDKVSGSSLSPKGFNDALAKIKAQAAKS